MLCFKSLKGRDCVEGLLEIKFLDDSPVSIIVERISEE